MMRAVLIVGMAATLAGCGLVRHRPDPAPAAAPAQSAIPAPEAITASALPTPDAVRPEALDSATKAERAAATAPTGEGTRIGTTVASLGDPTEAGFWLRTPLVSAPAKGRVTVGGASVAVDLIPLDGAPGAGSQISLSAMRMLGLTLTDLPELTVYAL